MSIGRPDFHPTMLLEGKHDTTLVPVLVDAAGQMYIVMTGAGGLTVNLDAAGNIIARLQGYDGAALKDVKVDTAGNLISRMKGYDGADLQDVKVDDAGYMLAKMTGIEGANLRTVAVDADGIMKANLAVQDLNYLKVRPVYGAARRIAPGTVSVPHATWTEIISVSGKGAALGGVVYFTTYFDPTTQEFRVEIDDAVVAEEYPALAYAAGMINNTDYPLYVLKYEPVTYYCIMGIGKGLTFESKFRILAYQTTGSAKNVNHRFYYALVP